jgi:hypothetical protein
MFHFSQSQSDALEALNVVQGWHSINIKSLSKSRQAGKNFSHTYSTFFVIGKLGMTQVLGIELSLSIHRS